MRTTCHVKLLLKLDVCSACHMQLQEYSQRQQQLELKYRPLVQQLPALQQALRPDELAAAAEFAATEGMRQPIMQVRGAAAAVMGCASSS
jgi:hypothetical protein